MDKPAATRRQLILCFDGTNNTLTGQVHDTNVLKLVARLTPDNNGQLLYYDPGVGSPDQVPAVGITDWISRKWERISGLASGKGIYENVEQAYEFLTDHYRPGDQIFLFGFSRGAFTARCVAGMVNLFGIIRPESQPLIVTLVRVYFSTPKGSTGGAGIVGRLFARSAHNADRTSSGKGKAPAINTREEVAAQVREQFTSAEGRVAPIHFVGVWDTVSSVGLPIIAEVKVSSDAFSMEKQRFRHIRHALALDEHRASFRPRLYWDQQDYELPDLEKSLKQRWFRGAHCDVGGGYLDAEAGLSNQALEWMLSEAVSCGLRGVESPAEGLQSMQHLVAHDECYVTPYWGIAGLVVRDFHQYPGSKIKIEVRPQGAAETSAPVQFAWSRGIKWIPLLLFSIAALIAAWVCGALSYAALKGVPMGAGWPPAKAWTGALDFDRWQRSCFGPLWCADLHRSFPTLAHFAKNALLVDFVFIACYSWLLGLLVSRAFAFIAGWRDLVVSPPRILVLGWAPCVAVAGDVIENLSTFAVLHFEKAGSGATPVLSGLLMLAGNLLKWGGILACVFLVIYGEWYRIFKRRDLVRMRTDPEGTVERRLTLRAAGD